MRVEKCNFCSGCVYPGKGTVFVRNDARKFRFCRKKCRLAFMKKKNPVRTKWTKASRISKQKELATEVNELFEKRRIVMHKYDSELMNKTLQALPEVLKIVQKKKDHHILKRLAVGTEDRKARDLYYVKNKQHLIRAPHARETEEESDEEENYEDEEMEEIENMDIEEDLKVTDVIRNKNEQQEHAPIKRAEKTKIYEML